MTDHDKLILNLIKEALSRTELSAEQQKAHYEALTREFTPDSLRILITSSLSVTLENIIKNPSLLSLK
ncbi:hypothetical protein [Frederiksenia canicola]